MDKITVTRSDHNGPPLEKHKKIKELSPPLTKDTVLYFSVGIKFPVTIGVCHAEHEDDNTKDFEIGEDLTVR